MVRPAYFSFNTQTEEDNSFQHRANESDDIAEAALKEFNEAVLKLRKAGILVTVVDDTATPHKPDAIFPNNWVSFHADGTVVFYPMMAPNRRQERRWDALEQVLDSAGFKLKKLIDLSKYEQEQRFLEGTGSLVLDTANGLAFAAVSKRTDASLAMELCERLHLELTMFQAIDPLGIPVYHTNVVLCLASEFAIVCSEAIVGDQHREQLLFKLAGSGRNIIDISFSQMGDFCGNCIELANEKGENFLCVSQRAYQSFNQNQLSEIGRHANILTFRIPTIEHYGGGSIRCMICEVR